MQLTELNFIMRESVKMMSSLRAVMEIPPFFENLVVYLPEGVHSACSQECKMDLFARLVNVFKLTLLSIFPKCYITDVRRDPEYAPDLAKCRQLTKCFTISD